MRKQTEFACALLAVFLLSTFGYAGDNSFDAVAKLINTGISVEKTSTTTAGTQTVPPNQFDTWKFSYGAVERSIRYSRYLNKPPHFTGNYPSLSNGDMGIGFDGGAFGNWYRNNTIRVLLNGQNLTAAQEAAKTESKVVDDYGYLRITWDLDNNQSFTLSFVVPVDGGAIYAEVEASPQLAVNSLGVQLFCFPGGYGPAYGQPSHRWVQTAKAQAEVPLGYDPQNANPKIQFSAGEEWIFYADKITNNGSLGLLVVPEEKMQGDISVTSYGQYTTIYCPPQTREFRLAFFAYETDNKAAQTAFMSNMPKELNALKKMVFWPDKDQ